MPFVLQKSKFVTTLSPAEIRDQVRIQLQTKSRLPFFSEGPYVGSINGNEFEIGLRKRGQIYSQPVVRGSMWPEGRTSVVLQLEASVFMVCFLSIFPLIFIPAAFLSDEMTINGVLREPTMGERITFALTGVVTPGMIFYLSNIRPLHQLLSKLINALKLDEIKT